MADPCSLCAPETLAVLWQDRELRVVQVADPDYPGFLRVIWQAHVREMTDLPPRQRARCMAVVFAVEATLREVLRPEKINLASLGNQVPHLHWHVIPRFGDDAHFPDPVWAPRRRPGLSHRVDATALARRLQGLLAGHDTNASP